MDKQEKSFLIARAAQEPEDRLLLARVLDKQEQMERRNIPAATGFLSPREQMMAVNLLNAAGIREGHILDGGYEGAERKVLTFLPDWAEEDPEALAFLRATFRGAESTLTHRDILGSLMGQGITRERVGDILISDHSADVVVSPSLAEFLLQNWDSAGRVRLEVSAIVREELTIPQVQIKEVRDTVSSLRLDAVVAAAFSLSRGKAAELIAAGRVSLDHVPCEKPDKPVSQGAVITARGLGKARVAECGRTTKKGRIALTIERYV